MEATPTKSAAFVLPSAKVEGEGLEATPTKVCCVCTSKRAVYLRPKLVDLKWHTSTAAVTVGESLTPLSPGAMVPAIRRW